jgi:hypothetical protein
MYSVTSDTHYTYKQNTYHEHDTEGRYSFFSDFTFTLKRPHTFGDVLDLVTRIVP